MNPTTTPTLSISSIRNRIISNSNRQILTLLLIAGLSFVISNTHAQTYDPPVTVSVDNGGRTVGTPGYISVDAQRVDNSTHTVSAMPNYNNIRLEGWLMVGADTIYYGTDSGNLWYKVEINGTWELIINSINPLIFITDSILLYYFRLLTTIFKCNFS